MTMPDAAALVAVRGRLMSAAPGGAMLAVGLDEREVVLRLHDGLSLAAVNGPSACVVAGGHDVVDALQGVLAREGVAVARLRTSHAFHSHLMDEVVERFRDEVAARTLLPPQMPFVSNLTGRWIQPAEATDPGYWARHLRQPVRFADGILEAARTCTRFVECGPGNALAALARQVLGPGEASVLTTLPRAESAERGEAEFLSALCSMWTDGVALDWTALADRPARRRVALPTYPFERHRFWIDPAAPSPAGLRGSASRVETGLQFSVPSWQRSPVPLDMASPSAPARRWLVLEDSLGLGAAIAERLDAAGHTVTRATVPDRPMAAGDHEGWLARAQAAGGPPQVIVYCASASPHPPTSLATARARAFDGPVGLVRALFSRGLFSPVRLEIVSSNLWDVLGDEPLDPLQALLVGPLRVAPQEYPTIRSRNIDIVWRDNSDVGSAADEVVRELSSEPDEQTVAIRTGYRWVQRYVSAPLPRDTRVGGAPVIIFGGFGNIGLTAARAFADMGDTRLVLAGRRLNRQLPGVRDLEARGVDLLLLEAELENEAAVRAVFASARARFGRVGTVVHAAGPAGDAAMASLADATPEHVDGHFGAKVRGLMNLTAVVGGLGMAAYAASNAVMDAVAAARNRCGATRWLAVNWDGWRFDGTQDPSSIGSSSGAAAFARITQANLPARVVVAAQPLEPRLGQWINPGARETTAEARVSRRASTSATPPTNEVEQVVLQAWVDLLGVENIGIDDDFFGLGGHSLLATQLVSRLRRALLLDVPLRAIFDGPTVRAIAGAIVAAETSPGRAAAAARLRLQVTQMTPDQLKTMLAARQSPAERAVR
jgi:acyl transferase domain-containing protein